eukprot:TRINITY_DN2489_c0_g1_i12.p1 TRINITY_DN2489_c0_g1~~TRINITY_DN2489_c0_g1_i12.p1  ORF type:complete len:562 (+),score=-87.30 TRINITY_DN2489_c0_g1_i12:57-1742(+)
MRSAFMKIEKKNFKVLVILAAFCFVLISSFAINAYINKANAEQTGRGVIVIDPGHGWTDPGAIGTKTSGEVVEEKMLNAKVSYKLGKALQSAGYDVSLTHDISYCTEVPQDLPVLLGKVNRKYDISGELVPAINQKNPDLMISIHQNSAASSQANGYECYFRTAGVNSNLHEKSIYLANKTIDYCNGLNYINSRGVKDGQLLVLKNNVPSVLFECGFMSNPSECDNLCDDAKQTQMSNCLVNAVNDYIAKYGSKYGPTAKCEKISSVKPSDNSSVYTTVVYGVETLGNLEKVLFPTFEPGSTQAVWHEGYKVRDGAWAFSYDGTGKQGEFRTHVYAQVNGKVLPLGGSSIQISGGTQTPTNTQYITKKEDRSTDFMALSYGVNPQGTSYTRVTNLATGVMVGHAPLVYTGANTYANYCYNYDGNLGKRTGEYLAECIINGNVVASARTELQGPKAESVTAVKPLENSAVFYIHANGVNAPYGIDHVDFAVWADGKEGVVWTRGIKVDDTTYALAVDIKDHNNYTGTYNVHAYGHDVYQNNNFIGKTQVNICLLYTSDAADE